MRKVVSKRSGTSKIKKLMQNYTNFRIFTVLFAVLLAVALFAIIRLVTVVFENTTAERGYRDLRQFAPGDVQAEYHAGPGPGQLVHGFDPEVHESENEDEEDDDEPEPPEGMILEPGPDLININSHYAGWIRIDNTQIDYPMVQSNNTRYLDTTFWGTHNRAGTLFLDERNPKQFIGSFVIVYGHNTRTGAMFGSLIRYVTGDYLGRHPNMTIYTREGEMLTYRIFAAFSTDIYDNLFTLFDADEERVIEYFAFHGAPAASTNFIALSTCTTGNSDDERVIVLAAR